MLVHLFLWGFVDKSDVNKRIVTRIEKTAAKDSTNGCFRSSRSEDVTSYEIANSS